jgi:hypothetical protein
MHLSNPRALSSWISSTGGRRIEDYPEHIQAAGRQSVVDVQVLLRIFYGHLGRFTDTACIFFSFFLGFCVLFHPLSLEREREHAPIYLLPCPGDRAPRRRTVLHLHTICGELSQYRNGDATAVVWNLLIW